MVARPFARPHPEFGVWVWLWIFPSQAGYMALLYHYFGFRFCFCRRHVSDPRDVSVYPQVCQIFSAVVARELSACLLCPSNYALSQWRRGRA